VSDGRGFYFGDTEYPITLGFGEVVPETAMYGPHTGLDLGTPLPALLTGRVVDVRRERLGGLQVKLQDDSGATALFAHLDEARVIAGEPVTRDTIIGLTGMSGEAVTGPHVHIETRSQSGQLVDPVAFFGGASSSSSTPTCPMGYTYDPATRSCKSWVPGGIVPNVPVGGRIPESGDEAVKKAVDPVIGGAVQGAVDAALGPIGGAISGAVTTIAFLAVVGGLVFIGGRRLLGN